MKMSVYQRGTFDAVIGRVTDVADDMFLRTHSLLKQNRSQVDSEPFVDNDVWSPAACLHQSMVKKLEQRIQE